MNIFPTIVGDSCPTQSPTVHFKITEIIFLSMFNATTETGEYNYCTASFKSIHTPCNVTTFECIHL